MSGYAAEYVTSAVLIVRIEPTADASFAAMRERSKFGIAIAAMIRIIATTINNSINEKPFCLRICFSFLSHLRCLVISSTHRLAPTYVFQRSWAEYPSGHARASDVSIVLDGATRLPPADFPHYHRN